MKNFIRAAVAAAALLATTAASAASYEFSYTMLNNIYISGSFDGNAQGNIIGDISKLAVTINGVAMPNSGNLYTYAANANGPARFSFDGLETSLLATDGDIRFPFSAIFLIGPMNGLQTDAIAYTVAGLADYGEGNGDYSASRWSLKEASVVPEPATYAMLLAGLALMGGVARRQVTTNKP